MGSDSPSLAADYAVLEVPWSASADEIQSAYRQMLMVWHPDRFPGDPSLRRRAEEKTKSITVAYSRIRHAPLRNASLTPRAAPTPPPSQAVHRSEPGPPPPKPRRVEPRPGRHGSSGSTTPTIFGGTEPILRTPCGVTRLRLQECGSLICFDGSVEEQQAPNNPVL